MPTRPERDESERDSWQQQFHGNVQPPLDVQDRVEEMRRTLAKTKTKTKPKEQP
jgi:hypothetical protein